MYAVVFQLPEYINVLLEIPVVEVKSFGGHCNKIKCNLGSVQLIKPFKYGCFVTVFGLQ
jgi:hypothetical protein